MTIIQRVFTSSEELNCSAGHLLASTEEPFTEDRCLGREPPASPSCSPNRTRAHTHTQHNVTHTQIPPVSAGQLGNWCSGRSVFGVFAKRRAKTLRQSILATTVSKSHC